MKMPLGQWAWDRKQEKKLVGGWAQWGKDSQLDTRHDDVKLKVVASIWGELQKGFSHQTWSCENETSKQGH